MVQEISSDADSESDEESDIYAEIFMGMIHEVNSVNPESDWAVNCKVKDQSVKMHVDTGAKCNVVSQNVLQRLKFNETIQRSEAVLKSFSGHTMKSTGLVVLVVPNGSMRLCLDPRDLNKAIRRPHYPMLTIEEIVSRMPNAKYLENSDSYECHLVSTVH